MKKTTRRPPDDAEQSKLFLQKAREIEADEKKSVADRVLERLAGKKLGPKKGTDK